MHNLIDYGTDESWQADDFNFLYDRVVTGIDNNQITLDAPLGSSLDHNYGGGWIYKYEYLGRIENVGIENIRGVSEYDTTWVQGTIGQAQQGDFNRDGCIGFSDFLAFAAHYGLREGQTRYNARYDLDGDKIIGFGDFLIFAAHFG